MATPDDVLNVERGELGYSRWNDDQAGTKYGRWYADRTGESYYGTSGVPFCAMFQSYCLDQAGVSAPGMPGAYCPWILDAGRNEGRMIYNEVAKPGDLVLFDWGGDSVPDHIGIVEENHPESNYLCTIEGNTNNGCVARRTRAYSTIAGIIRPYYDDTSTGGTIDSGSTSSDQLDVDGWWGPATTTKLQQVLGTPVDGVVSQQPSCNRSAVLAAGDGWEWVDNADDGGSTCIRALQGVIGCDQDGYFGPDSANHLEAHFGIDQDGVLDGPSNTVMRMQEALNEGHV
jgi:hypothetical protein